MISKDEGIAVALMERFESQRLPRAMDIKAKVDGGEKLSNTDIEFLNQVFKDANRTIPLISKHPEYQDLATNILHLYHEITQKALENEKNS
jgi:hypothetical protein